MKTAALCVGINKAISQLSNLSEAINSSGLILLTNVLNLRLSNRQTTRDNPLAELRENHHQRAALAFITVQRRHDFTLRMT